MIYEHIVMLAIIANNRKEVEVTWAVTICVWGFIENFLQLEHRRQPRAKFFNFISSDDVTLPTDWNTKKAQKLLIILHLEYVKLILT